MNALESILFSILLDKHSTLQRLDERFSYLMTLKKKPINDVSTIGDFLKIESTKKKIQDLQEAILQYQTELISLSSGINTNVKPIVIATTTVSIPYSNTSEKVHEMLRSFVRDYIEQLKNNVNNKQSRPKIMPWMINAIQMKYLWESPRDCVCPQSNDIAPHLGVTGESVRSAMKRFSHYAVDICSGNGSHYGITASPTMLDAFNKFKSFLRPVFQYPDLKRSIDADQDDRTLRFFLDGLDYSISSQAPGFCIEQSFGGDSSLHFLNRNYRQAISFLNQKVAPIRFELEIVPYFKKEMKWNAKQIELMKAYLMSDDIFEWTEDSLQNKMLALKWKELTVGNRLVRIVYDYNKQKGWDQYISLQEVVREYNLRAIHNQVTPLEGNVSSVTSPLIEKLGNGQYRYGVKSTAKQTDIPKELAGFIAGKGGQVTFQKAKDFVHAINPSYSDASIDLFLRKAGCRQQNGTYVFTEMMKGSKNKPQLEAEKTIKTVAKILVDKGGPLRIKEELIPVFLPKYPVVKVNPISFRNILKRADGILFSFPQGSIDLIITKDLVQSFDFGQFSATNKYRSLHLRMIRNLAVETLVNAPNHTMAKKDLVSAVKHLYPEGKSSNNIYTVFGKDPIFIDNGNNSYSLDVSLYKSENKIVDPNQAINDDHFDWDVLKNAIVSNMTIPYLNAAVCDKMYSIIQSPDDGSIRPKELFRMLFLLNKYFANNANSNEQELLVYKLFLGLETYLRCYSFYRYLDKSGLAAYIKKLQDDCRFPDPQGSYKIGSVSQQLNNLTGLMISIRNNISHTLNEGYNNEQKQKDNILQAIKYYLLIAAYSLEHN